MRTCFLFLALFLAQTALAQPHPPLKLWYKTPANAQIADVDNGWKDDPEWLKALPLGNGSLGAMVFGDVNRERIQLNEESMWSGSPDDNNNPNSFAAQAEIRKLLYAGKYKEATELTDKTQISKGAGSGNGNGTKVPYGSFQTLGELYLDFANSTPYTDYYRELDLHDAAVRVRYTQNGVRYSREAFVSYPDQVMAIRLTADKPGALSFKARLWRPERFRTYAADNQLIMAGNLSDGKGGDGLAYMTRLKAGHKGGTVAYTDAGISVSGATEVILYLTASTDYKLQHPTYRGRDHVALTARSLQQAMQKPYARLLSDHLTDYRRYFDRTSFTLFSGNDTQPTDERLAAFKTNRNDPHLYELLFQYGRYLLISSSRPGTLPANLQGIWGNKIQTPWNGDYHTNINIQMNYWPAEVTNLPELHLPFFDLLRSLTTPGAETARVHYHARGWVMHPITNVWGYTAPGEQASWGMHTGATAWLCSHIAEHYRYTQDKAFLRQMYPVLKAATEFYMDWLVVHPQTGKLVSGPAGSPENTFIAPDGSKSQISMGPAHEQQVIWQLFQDFGLVSKALGISDSWTRRIAEAQGQLAGPQIGADGRLMEWAEPFKEAEPGHRHISHLFALHPGHQINAVQTPDLMDAVRKSLDYRMANGGGHTGWSAAWLVSQYARLGEAEKAKASLDVVGAKSTSINLFGQHPPFQMDANFGTTAGIAEMLLQSHVETPEGGVLIDLLPALPASWANGAVGGLVARGGYNISMNWKSGQLEQVTVEARQSGRATLRYKDQSKPIMLKKGEKRVYRF
ncbi:glycoside hydrolase family 95 protein [Rudanella paleaurantiibacter]|uniref:Glycoside hydrolase family 95 protein n=1 Tax=Rudanella paleaurantiibacter TaxID=2614655 RepID=A0A7J5TW61_9BACT|nr:glycoside hydrolase family 95 protein [Rudanella paleaurantiibacter]KAB7728690.1 glycoside hydrolase family 95 protein [Rudanella paleaurantiibacter]